MLSIITPLTGTVYGGASFAGFALYGSIATCLLVVSLILKELWSTMAEENQHYRQIVQALNIVIYPLFFIFCVITVLKVFEAL